MKAPLQILASDWALTMSRRRPHLSAFSLQEVVVVIAVITLLALLALSGNAKAKSKAESIFCLNNQRQLQLGWLNYAHENDDTLPPNRAESVELDHVAPKGSWVVGNAQLDTDDLKIREGLLFPYVPGTAVYSCPSDRSTVHNQPGLQRKRSYSIEIWLNAESNVGAAADEINKSKLNIRKLTRVDANGAAGIFVFIDEHPISIDDGVFTIQNRAYASDAPPAWGAFPASRHNRGANLSYADGHAEYQRWRRERNIKMYTGGKTSITNANDSIDLTWLQERLPRKP